METFFMVVALILGVALIVLLAARPPRTSTSHFELQRRAKAGDTHAQTTLRHEALRNDVTALLRSITWLLLVLFVLALLAAFGWAWGAVVAIGFVIVSALLARLSAVRSLSKRLYTKYESTLFAAIEKFPQISLLLREPHVAAPHEKLESLEHFSHLVNQSQGILRDEEKQLIRRSVGFYDVDAKQIMTPIDEIVTVASDELLGPLVLDDLHKTGHHYFPVVAAGGKEPIGILELGNVVVVHTKHASQTAQMAMNKTIASIDTSARAYDALTKLLEERQHVLLVKNESGEVVGLLTLGDVMKVLFGNNYRGGVE